MKRFLLGMSLVLLPVMVGAQPAPGGFGGMSGPVEVGVLAVSQEEIPFRVVLPARAVAAAQTQVRPRIEGVIEEVVYTPGGFVEVGDVLFRLEGDTYEMSHEAAQIEVESAQISVDTAAATVARYEKLEGTGVASSEVATARASLAQARASLSAAQVALKAAALNVERVNVRSPIAGLAGVSDFGVGDLVTANQSEGLVTVTSYDPIHIDVSESSSRILKVRSRINAGILEPGDKLQARVTLENGEVYEGIGELVSPGFEVSTTTGSVDLRFTFPNPDRMIMPGQFLRVEIEIGQERGVLVPQRATTRQSDGTLSAFVVKDGKAREVEVEYNGVYENAWIVTSGVEAGDSVVLDGLDNIREGSEVSPVPVTINAAGLVIDVVEGDK